MDEAGANRERALDLSFLSGVGLKVVNVVGDLLIGIPLLFLSAGQLTSWAQAATSATLAQDPDAPIANFVVNSTAGLSTASLDYAAIYLLIHATVKIAILIGLVRGSLRFYPWVMAALVALLVYQFTDFAITHSILMLVLSLLDSIVVWLTWREWRQGRVLRDVLERRWPTLAARWPFAAPQRARADAPGRSPSRSSRAAAASRSPSSS